MLIIAAVEKAREITQTDTDDGSFPNRKQTNNGKGTVRPRIEKSFIPVWH